MLIFSIFESVSMFLLSKFKFTKVCKNFSISRGQLGHGDLEDCDEPKLIEALAGLKVVQISASGWHSAVVTNQVCMM